LDGTEAIIPNDSIIGNMLLNHTYTDRVVAVKAAVSVSFHSDLEKAIALFLAAGKSQARVLETPAPSVLIRNIGDNGIELELIAWIRDAEEGQGSLRSGVYLEVLRAFREEGIEIPFPQREVRVIPPGAAVAKNGDLCDTDNR
jgi:small-conductance mechanosensitive channel